MSSKKQLFWRTSINLMAKIIAQLLNLALIPIYVSYLQTTKYGILNLSFVFLNFLVLFGLSGLNDALIRFYSKARNPKTQKILFSSVFFFVTLLTLFIGVILALFKDSIAGLMYNDQSQGLIFILVLIAGLLEAWNMIIIVLLHAEKKTVTYGVSIISKNLLKLIATYILLDYFNLGIYGALLGIIVGAMALNLLALPLVVKKITFKLSKRMFKILFRYGLPFIVSGLAMNLLFQVDQVILKFMIGLEAVAIYGLSYKLGSAVQYFNTSFSLAWFPHLFSLEKEQAKKTIPEFFSYYFVVTLMLGSTLTILNNLFLEPFLPEDYKAAITIIPWIIWGYIIYGLSDFLGAGLFIRYKSKIFSILSGITALVNILLNIIFITFYGIQAAAVVTFISFLLFTTISHFLAQRQFPISFEYGTYLKVLLPFTVLIAASYYGFGDSVLSRIMFGLLLIILSMAIPFIFRYINLKQLKNLLSIKSK
jgi:O-antigen/teichoic acid export membrane protein